MELMVDIVRQLSFFGVYSTSEGVEMNKYKLVYLKRLLKTEREERNKEVEQMRSMIEALAKQNQLMIKRIQELQGKVKSHHAWKSYRSLNCSGMKTMVANGTLNSREVIMLQADDEPSLQKGDGPALPSTIHKDA